MDQKREQVVPYKVINYAGAFIALLIGSGFATGQELLQYFASWGYWGIAGIAAVFILMAYVGVSFVSAGYHNRFENPNDIYKYYCGNIIGSFYDYFSVFFLFLSYTVMVAGAGATFEQHYGLSSNVGSVILMICAMATVVFGLNRIVDIIGNIGPVIVVMAILVGAISIGINYKYADTAIEAMKGYVASGEVKVASTSWWLAAGSYVGFCMLWLAAFLAQVGAGANSDKEGKLGAFFGSFGFSLACLIMFLAILFGITKLGGSQIPSLILAGEIHPVLATIYSVIIFLGIYTTAVPLLWSVIARFAKEGTNRFRILTLALGVIGGFIGVVLRFDTLVNYVYVINGYVGMVLLAIMIFRSIQWKRI